MLRGYRTPTPVLVDASTTARLLNRYVAIQHFKKFDTKHGLEGNDKIIEEKTSLKIQWKNIKADVKGIFRNPFVIAPKVAYSMLAFLFIALGKHEMAMQVAFFGSVAYDSAGQTSHSGEPSTITWSHTVGTGDNRLINVNASGLSTPNAPQWDGNATTEIISENPLRCYYYLNPTSGSANCTADGGNIKVGGSISFENVDQTDPIGASTSESGSSSPNDMSLTTDGYGSMRVDVLGSNRDDASSPTGTLDSGTLRCDDVVAQNQFRIGLFAYTNAQETLGSDTHQWTTSGFNRYYTAFEIHAVRIVVDNVSVSGNGTDTGKTWSHTVGDGENRILLVGIHVYNTGANKVTSVTYNGDALAQVSGSAVSWSSLLHTQWYYMVAPDVGTANIVVSLSGGSWYNQMEAISLRGVHQTIPIGDVDTASGSGSAPTTNVTSDFDKSYAIDTISTRGTYANTIGSGQELIGTNYQSGVMRSSASYEYKASAGAVTMDWASVADGWTSSSLIVNDNTQVAITDSDSRDARTFGGGSNYTREAKSSLPTTDTDLATAYDSSDESDVATDDSTRVALTSTSNGVLVHQFKEWNSNNDNTESITVSANLQTVVAPSVATVYLQIYNYNSASWENLDSDNSSSANTDFDLSGIISASQSNYYTNGNFVAVRIYQDTS